jgi:hypothetical protein
VRRVVGQRRYAIVPLADPNHRSWPSERRGRNHPHITRRPSNTDRADSALPATEPRRGPRKTASERFGASPNYFPAPGGCADAPGLS